MLTRDEDQVEAMELIRPILPFLYRLLMDSVEFYYGPDYSDAARAEHDGRAMANCIYSHAEKRMTERVDSLPGARVFRHRRLVTLNYLGRVSLRAKKVNAEGRHRNVLTAQQLDYDFQMPLPNIPSAFRLTAGYELDAFNTTVQRIMIARPVGRKVWWTSQVVVADEAAIWTDITPNQALGDLDSIDFDAVRRARRNHGSR